MLPCSCFINEPANHFHLESTRSFSPKIFRNAFLTVSLLIFLFLFFVIFIFQAGASKRQDDYFYFIWFDFSLSAKRKKTGIDRQSSWQLIDRSNDRSLSRRRSDLTNNERKEKKKGGGGVGFVSQRPSRCSPRARCSSSPWLHPSASGSSVPNRRNLEILNIHSMLLFFSLSLFF